jgi:AcrR family transcriptional regulator
LSENPGRGESGPGGKGKTVDESVGGRHQKAKEREETILGHARALFLAEGYFGLTMDRVAASCGVAKGTVYLAFSCKEEIIIALAEISLRKRSAMMRRASAFRGLTRERMQGLGEAVGLFSQLYPGDSRIIHTAMGPLREKIPPLRLRALELADWEELAIVRGVVVDAIQSGELTLPKGASVEELLLGTWGLVDGAYALIEGGAPNALELADPFDSLWRFWSLAVDGYGWRPLFSEWDYAESLARVRREVFPEEAKMVFGEGWDKRRG